MMNCKIDISSYIIKPSSVAGDGWTTEYKYHKIDINC